VDSEDPEGFGGVGRALVLTDEGWEEEGGTPTGVEVSGTESPAEEDSGGGTKEKLRLTAARLPAGRLAEESVRGSGGRGEDVVVEWVSDRG
jgi:hypothetical protein